MSPVKLPYTTYQQREPFYSDIFQFLSPGFITQQVKIQGVSFNLRSPFSSDYLLSEQSFGKDEELRDWVCKFLSLCTWEVDQHIITDPNLSRRVFKCYKSLPISIINCLFGLLRELITRMGDSLQSLLVFSQESFSRFLWAQYGGQYQQVIVRQSLSPYKELNSLQKVWSYHNFLKDSEETEIRNFFYVRSLLAPHAPKGVQSWAAQEKSKLERMEEEKRILLDEFYYKKIGVLDEKGFDRVKNTGSSKTYESLSDEFKRWVRGELDEHDHAVEEFKEDLRSKWESRKKKREQLRDLYISNREQMGEEGDIPKPFKMVGYSEEQLRHILQKKETRVIDRDGSSYIYEGWVEKKEEVSSVPLQEAVQQRSKKLAGESDV